MLLLRGGLHLPVGGVEVVEVLRGVVCSGVGGGLFEDHRLVQRVNGADLSPRLDPGEKPQRIGAVSPGADTEPIEQLLRELGIGVRDEHRGPAGLQGPPVELLCG